MMGSIFSCTGLASEKLPFKQLLTMPENKVGYAFATTEITPIAPHAISGRVMPSSPLITSKPLGLSFMILERSELQFFQSCIIILMQHQKLGIMML